MLVLTRRVHEAIVIGGCISVRVLMVKGDKVRIGIDAPKEVPVLRTEVIARMKAAEERAVALENGTGTWR